jgi:fatty acid synthase subunit beta
MAGLFSSTIPTRPLVLHSPSARVSIPVAASPLSAWVQSETLSQQFHDSRIGVEDDIIPVEEDEDAVKTPPSNEPQVKLLARFLGFTADRASADSTSEVSQVLSAAFDRFNELFLGSENIHTLVENYERDVRAEVLSAYYKAFAVGRQTLGEGKLKVAHPSALLGAANAGEAELYALFGGQGVNEVSASPTCRQGRVRWLHILLARS